MYAEAICAEVKTTQCSTFDLIGGSWGGVMAHQIAIAAHRFTSVAPRHLVLIDPYPPVIETSFLGDFGLTLLSSVVSFPPPPLGESVTILLALMLGSAGHYEDIDHHSTLYDSIKEQVGSWTDDELVVQATRRLVAEGLMEDCIQAATTFGCYARVLSQSIALLQTHLAMQYEPPAVAPCETLLVLASQRTEFFEAVPGMTRQTASTETAMKFGNIARVLVLTGSHLAVVQRCSTGADKEFTRVLLDFIDEDAQGDE